MLILFQSSRRTIGVDKCGRIGHSPLIILHAPFLITGVESKTRWCLQYAYSLLDFLKKFPTFCIEIWHKPLSPWSASMCTSWCLFHFLLCIIYAQLSGKWPKCAFVDNGHRPYRWKVLLPYTAFQLHTKCSASLHKSLMQIELITCNKIFSVS